MQARTSASTAPTALTRVTSTDSDDVGNAHVCPTGVGIACLGFYEVYTETQCRNEAGYGMATTGPANINADRVCTACPFRSYGLKYDDGNIEIHPTYCTCYQHYAVGSGGAAPTRMVPSFDPPLNVNGIEGIHLNNDLSSANVGGGQLTGGCDACRDGAF